MIFVNFVTVLIIWSLGAFITYICVGYFDLNKPPDNPTGYFNKMSLIDTILYNIENEHRPVLIISSYLFFTPGGWIIGFILWFLLTFTN